MAKKKPKTDQFASAPELNEDKKTNEKENIFEVAGELAVDVFETDSDFVVSTAIAGVKIQDLDIAVEKDMMVIKGNRLNPHNAPDQKYIYRECYWGPFSKKIVLPDYVDVQKADAQMDKGVLTIKIPKTAGGSDSALS